jgi:sulfite exporter TauE/SafE
MEIHGSALHGVATRLDLLAFLILGLVGSIGHCVGMCSPFVLIVARRFGVPEGRHSPLAAQLWYSGGRILTYTVLGAVAGAFGGLVDVTGALFGLQRTAAVGAGVGLVGWALASLSPRSRASHGHWLTQVTSRLGRRLPGHPLTVGLFLGLLPCGLLYTAIVAAIARGGPLAGAAALAAFGAGTIPALLGVSLADVALVRRRGLLNQTSQLFVMAMGLWFVWRGLGPSLVE